MTRPSRTGAVIRATREDLVRRFPLCFRTHGTEKLPLKLSIALDVIAEASDMDRTLIFAAIRDYKHGPKYLRHILAGAVRIDLDGQPAGVVTDREEARAKRQIERQDRRRKAWLKRQVERMRLAEIEEMAA